MNRALIGVSCLFGLSLLGHFTASKWVIPDETLTFHDPAGDNRVVTVEMPVRHDQEMLANAGMITLPVAILRATPSKIQNIHSSSTTLLCAGISRQPSAKRDPGPWQVIGS
jgi:hypothetical protein